MSNRRISRHAIAEGWTPDHPEVRAATCTGKDPLTWAQAREIVDRTRVRRLSIYHCPVCRAWHVGSKGLGKRRKAWRVWG